SPLVPDRRASRPLPAGTVARGQLREEPARATGKVSGRGDAAAAAALAGFAPAGPLAGALNAGSVQTALLIADYTTALPFPLTLDVLERGRERYTIFCAVCHDPAGGGNGKIVQRGYTRPPAFPADNSRGFALRGVAVRL